MNSNRTPPAANSQSANSINVGLELQRLRLRQTRTIEAIAEALKLTTDMVNHLENNNFDKLPNKVFVRGYIRNYLNLLDVPKDRADDLIAQFNHYTSHSVEAQAGHRSATEQEHRRQDLAHRRIKLMGGEQRYKIDAQGARWKIWLALAAITSLVVVGWLLFIQPAAQSTSASGANSQVNLLSGIDSAAGPAETGNSLAIGDNDANTNSPPNAELAVAIPLATNELIIDNSISEIEITPEAVTTNPAPVTTAVNVDDDANSERVEQPEPNVLLPMGSMPETAQILQPEPALRLVLNFSEQSWIEIRDGSGEVLVDGLYGSEDGLNIEAIAPVSFHLGNSAATSVIYQGRELDYSAFINRNVARFTLAADGGLARAF